MLKSNLHETTENIMVGPAFVPIKFLSELHLYKIVTFYSHSNRIGFLPDIKGFFVIR